MKTYLVRRDGKERRLTIRPVQENRFEVVIDGSLHEVDVRSCDSDHLSMLVDNRTVEAAYTFQGERLTLGIRNGEFEMELVDERKRRRRSDPADNAAGPEIVKAAMPGKIIALLVKPGDPIAPKAAVLVMEAMKMENEIVCKRGGRVRQIRVVPGQTVEKDAILAEIEPEID